MWAVRILSIVLAVLPHVVVEGNVGGWRQVSAGSPFGGEDMAMVKSKIVEFLQKKEKQNHPDCETKVTLPPDDEVQLSKQVVNGINYKLQWKGTTYVSTCQKGENSGTPITRTDEKDCTAIYNVPPVRLGLSTFKEEPNC